MRFLSRSALTERIVSESGGEMSLPSETYAMGTNDVHFLAYSLYRQHNVQLCSSFDENMPFL